VNWGNSNSNSNSRYHLRTLGQIIQHCPDLPLKIEGYTDATPYIGGEQGYGNWELSTDRANAARRELLLNGVDGQRFWQVVGYGASKPVFPDSPNDPHNRRVSITIWVP
jgi:chemotaxis protein MotB